MFKGQPKGLLLSALSNLGERFGYYTMIAIFVLFLQAKYGYSEADAGRIYATFMLMVYFLPLLGGIVADRWLGYTKTVSLGFIIMSIGYLTLSFPSLMGHNEIIAIYFSLFVIAIGTGLFKGNLQAMVGRLYDNPTYEHKRDSGFSLFYMFINIGAMFAPTAAEAVVNFVMKHESLFYDSRIPELFHKMSAGGLTDSVTAEFVTLAQQQDPTVTLSTLQSFGSHYVDVLGQAYQWGFAIALIAHVVSYLIFLTGRKAYESAENKKESTDLSKEKVSTMSPKEYKDRIVALLLIFASVIFFWMAFHQNGLTLTYFARDYTATSVGKLTYIWFDLLALLLVAATVFFVYFGLRKDNNRIKKPGNVRWAYWGAALLTGVAAIYRIGGFSDHNPFTPQLFQHFNPFFIVILTPVAVAIFNKLGSKQKEPSAPKKIAYGMLIAGGAYLVMSIGSIGLLSPVDRGDIIDYTRVTPYWLISTYFLLTIAELFISPMGISFVSKVSPPKLKGMMQGGWFAATAIGNFLIQIGSDFWSKIPLWSLWLIFVACCCISAVFLFSIMKRLEKVAK